MAQRRRIGGVPFGVGAPLLAGLDRDPDLELCQDKPTILIEALRRGELDAALVSSIEGFRRPGYRALADLCITSRGVARSVRAFRSKIPIRTVGLDDSSATSATLLRILLAAQRLGPTDTEMSFTRIPPTTRPDELPFDLVLLIGDYGLAADPGKRSPIDLGEAWYQWTGLPFVFALWLFRPGLEDAAAAELARRLRQARSEARAKDVSDGTEGAICYDLGRDEQAGLQRFAAAARELGLAEEDCQPEFIGSD